MLPPIPMLRHNLQQIIAGKAAQGHDVKGLQTELRDLPESYDALHAFALKLADLPLKEGWPYVEPNDYEAIMAECDPRRPQGRLADISAAEATARAESAFEAAVAGCILGKPLEIDPTLEEIRTAAEATGEWPINDYITLDFFEKIGRRNTTNETCCRETIRFVAPDDDINYTIIGMLMLENHGLGFTRPQLAEVWLRNLYPLITHGPERMMLAATAMRSRLTSEPLTDADIDRYVSGWNLGDELCGAAIRVDAYGYACPGRPDLAAELAWRDSSWTHRRTGIYASMFIAAAIAAAFVERDRLRIFEIALQFVPRRSRFYEIMADCIEMVRQASDWLDGYRRIHAKYHMYRHCQLYQECGTLMNSARFAADSGQAICMQVSQGADTDCFGEIIGSIMGAYFGPCGLEPRWLAPFQDRLHTGLGGFHETSLSAVTRRMGRLPLLTV